MSEPSHSGKTILVVEDDAPTRALITTALQQAGYNVTGAYGKTEVLALVRFHPFDLVLTDVIMPEIDGTEVILAVKKYRRDTPVIAMSGGGSVMTTEFSLNLAKAVGAGIVLNKPFRLEELLATVDKALGSGGIASASKGREG
jgi:CheY-like chemotaxis protein